jgi:hypothetical protein
MSTHLFSAHQNDHDKPVSFLIVAGAILAALVILIALAALRRVCCGCLQLTTPTSRCRIDSILAVERCNPPGSNPAVHPTRGDPSDDEFTQR